MTQEETDRIFYAITSNGCRDMDEKRFNQAVNEVLEVVKNCSIHGVMHLYFMNDEQNWKNNRRDRT